MGSSRQGSGEVMSSYLYEVRYGLVLALATLAWITLEYAVGLHTTRIAYYPVVTKFLLLIHVSLMWRALKHRRDVLERGQLDWWQGMASGTVISVVAAAFAAPTIWIFTKFVNPNFFSAMIEFSMKNGDYMKTDHAEAYFNFIAYALQSTLGPVIFGFVASVALTTIARLQIERRETSAAKPA
jgi:hypothetical protein